MKGNKASTWQDLIGSVNNSEFIHDHRWNAGFLYLLNSNLYSWNVFALYSNRMFDVAFLRNYKVRNVTILKTNHGIVTTFLKSLGWKLKFLPIAVRHLVLR